MFYKGLDPMLVEMTAYYRRPDRKRTPPTAPTSNTPWPTGHLDGAGRAE